MKYDAIDHNLFRQNRENLNALLPTGSLVVLNSNDIMPTNADGVMPFRQNNDLFYLTGIDQEDTIFLMFPDFESEKLREVLFIRETNEHIAIWEGHKYTKEEAREVSGIDTVFWVSEFPKVFNTLMAEAEQVYLNTNEHIRADNPVQTRDARFIEDCKAKYPLHQYERVAPLLHQLRAIKSPVEVDQMQQACDITEQGFRRVLSFVRPGVMEYEIQAEYVHEFIRSRSRGFAYDPIIASGFSACVLHYVTNNQECRDGDMLLMDVGAEYANYNADMTRSIPVNGRFTDRQRQVYEAVLRAKKEAEKILRPGVVIADYQKEMERFIEGELMGLGLLDEHDIKNQDPNSPAYRKYFMHGVSHHIGLDVHDVGNIYQSIKPGMVFTIEPGIYIREEGLGIRLEDNYVVREEGLLNLMSTIPIEVEEIEEIMNAVTV